MKNQITIKDSMLFEVFKSFYTITGIKIVLFDVNYQEILSYPQTNCDFCTLLGKNDFTAKKCTKCNIQAFQQCKQSQQLSMYICHADLVEAVSPIIDDRGVTRGYLMIGQISTTSDKEALKQKLRNYLDSNNIDYSSENTDKLFKIKRYTNEQILASTKILDMCTKYILYNDYVSYEKETFLDKLDEYIQKHIKENLSIEILMEEFSLPRNALYNLSKKYINVGIAEYIKQYKLNYAITLLKETNYPISKVAIECGFSDYSYFCRVFKKEIGVSAHKYRQKLQMTAA